MSYSKEDIERKRQAALLRNQQRSVTPLQPKENTNALGPASNQKRAPQNFGTNQYSDTSGRCTNNGHANGISGWLNKKFAQNVGQRYSSQGNSFGKAQSSFRSTAQRPNPYPKTKTPNTFYGDKKNDKRCEVTCALVNESRFCADMTIFSAQLIEIFKTIPTKRYEPSTRIWDFHLDDYNLLLDKIKPLKSEIDFKGLPNFILHEFSSLTKENQTKKSFDLSTIDSTLLNKLYPFQKEGIEYGITKNGRCMIADDMGLGKTIQALGIASYYKKDWPLIIVTPSSVQYQWSDAILDNLPSVPAAHIQHIAKKSHQIGNLKITIVSYDTLAKRIDEFSARKFGVLICDESHYLKDGRAKRTQALQKLASKAQRIILLSGTPALSRPSELHPQIKLLIPTFFSWHDYGVRYCAGVERKFGPKVAWIFTGSSNTKELEIILKACCLIRRLKSDVMTQLPTKIRQKVILDPDLIKAGNKELEDARKEFEKDERRGAKTGAMFEYYRETSKAKEKAVSQYVTDLIENEQKFIIFGHHQNMLDTICEKLDSKKIMYVRIDGKTNSEQRKHFVDTFQNEAKVMAAVLSIKACYAGITLTAAQLVIFAELDWNPSILVQAEDRAHRIGQTDNVIIRYLLAKTTADDRMWLNLQQKTDVLNSVGLDQNFDLNKADLEKQPIHLPDHQQTLDDFFDSSIGTPSSSWTIEPSGNSDLHKSSDSLKDLLDVDDAAFDNIDLDSII